MIDLANIKIGLPAAVSGLIIIHHDWAFALALRYVSVTLCEQQGETLRPRRPTDLDGLRH
jgi:hypothetical protein